MAEHLAKRARICLEGELRVEKEGLAQLLRELRRDGALGLQHEIRVPGRTRNAIVVAGEGAGKQEGNPAGLQSFRHIHSHALTRGHPRFSIRSRSSNLSSRILKHSSSLASGNWLRMPASVMAQAYSKSSSPARSEERRGIAPGSTPSSS